MTFPSEEKLKKIRESLNKAEPSYLLPEDATKADILKSIWIPQGWVKLWSTESIILL